MLEDEELMLKKNVEAAKKMLLETVQITIGKTLILFVVS